jgi:hypothetical protein
VSEDDAHRDDIDNRSIGAVAVKPPRLRRAAMRHWGLTAKRARANPATVPCAYDATRVSDQLLAKQRGAQVVEISLPCCLPTL